MKTINEWSVTEQYYRGRWIRTRTLLTRKCKWIYTNPTPGEQKAERVEVEPLDDFIARAKKKYPDAELSDYFSSYYLKEEAQVTRVTEPLSTPLTDKTDNNTAKDGSIQAQEVDLPCPVCEEKMFRDSEGIYCSNCAWMEPLRRQT